jgi:5-amino-6-(5-phosphoribosylamino)uracil reductase
MSGLRLAERAPPDRPYVVANMVATADGRAAIDGSTVGMGGPVDRELFHELRTQVDAVMVGARTAAVERYGRLVRGDADRDKRGAEGVGPEPLACVVSGLMRLPADLPVLGERGAPVVIVTASKGSLGPVAADVSYVRAPTSSPARGAEEEEVDLRTALARLRSEHGVRSLLCEGGPTLNVSLLADGLIDELFLTLVPMVTAEPGQPPIVRNELPLEPPARMELLRVLEHDGHLFLRYRLPRR